MGSFSIWHWLVVLLIVVLVFGTKKLRNIGQDLGGAIRGFKEGLKGGEADAEKEGALMAKEATSAASQSGAMASSANSVPSASASATGSAPPPAASGSSPSSIAPSAGATQPTQAAAVIDGQIREKHPG